ncbi:MAG TPA: WD40 repeat domain-containing protein [Dehalococcoidia bacterium]|nr:WD40 repeat domain-containing protein [Dehalococcoidia bacterium]
MVERTVSERLIDQGHPSMMGKSVIVSPDCRRVAYMVEPVTVSSCFVVVDGQEGKHYDGVEKGSLVFSPNSQRVAYVARAGKKRFAVVDGQEENQYDRIEEQSLVFSSDSRRVGYVTRAGKKRVAVLDEQEGKQYDRVAEGSLRFSPDSQRVAYVARAGNKQFVVVDGQEQEQYDRIEKQSLVFSPDSQRMAYGARAGNKWFVVVNGQVDRQYDRIEGGSLVFSLDSQRVAYVAREAKKHFVVVDGQEQEQYNEIGKWSLVFSRNSQRVAHAANAGGWNGKWRVIVDGQEGKHLDGDTDGVVSIIFSPDSQRLAYEFSRCEGGAYVVVVDGQAQKEYDRVEGGLAFSPNSRRVAYVASQGWLPWSDHWFVVLDGREQELYNTIAIESLMFAPDSRRVAYVVWAATRRLGVVVHMRSLVVIDGEEGSQYNAIPAPSGGGGIIFDSPNQLHYIARKGNAFYLVEERLA